MAAPRLLLAGLLVQWGLGAEPPEPPPAPPTLGCTKWEGEKGRGEPVLLRVWGGQAPPPVTSPPRDDTFDVIDPWGGLTKVWGPPWTPPKCELTPTAPVVTPPAWAPTLGAPDRSPVGLGGSWWVLTLGTPGYGATALLQGQPHTPRLLNATLTLFTLTPELGGPLGSLLSLHCSFAAPPGPFALEWWHRDRGSSRRLLAYDSATAGVPPAPDGVPLVPEGVRLLLGTVGHTRDVTLRLPPLAVPHHGTYICSVFLPHGQAQQLLRLRVLEPPRVTLRPPRLVLAPGQAAELRCEASGYFPLDVGLRLWGPEGEPRASAPGHPEGGTPLGVTRSWSSGHRQGPDGTFSRSVRLWVRGHGGTYTCEVTHEALGDPQRLRVTVEVAGAEGPGAGDAVGLFLVAFVICGLWRRLQPSPPAPGQDPKDKAQ